MPPEPAQTGDPDLERAAMRRWLATTFPEQRRDGAPPTEPFSLIYDGQPSADFLAGWRRSFRREPADGGERLVIEYEDPATRLSITCEAICFDDLPAVDWVVRLTNHADQSTPMIDNILALDLAIDLPEDRLIIHYNKGSVLEAVDDYLPLNAEFGMGDHLELPEDRTRSQTFLPFFDVDLGDGGISGAIGWTGQWRLSVSRHADGARLQSGQQLTHLRLLPHETIRTPRMLLVHWLGTDRARGSNLIRRALISHYLPRLDGEVVLPPIAGGTGGLNDIPEAEELSCIDGSAGLGVEAYWRDAGWFVGGWPSGVGSWDPHPDMLPRGFSEIRRLAHQHGMKLLLWFEPERVHADSEIAAQHPEWILTRIDDTFKLPAGATHEGYHDGLFDLGNPEARAWLSELISRRIDDFGVDIYRHDRNTPPVWYWQANDAADRQGMTEIRYVEGLYAFLDDLRRRHPRLVIDNANWRCTGPDLEMTTRSSGSFSRSETGGCGADPIANQINTAGLSRYLPLHANGLYDLAPYMLRGVCTTGTAARWHNYRDPVNERLAKQAIAEIGLLRTMCMGDFYPLTEIDARPDSWCAWQFHRPDLGEGIAVCFRRPDAGDEAITVELQALEPDATYEVDWREGYEVARRARVLGLDLIRLEVRIGATPGSLLVHYQRAS